MFARLRRRPSSTYAIPPTDLKEFLYVDVDRTRSLLAQLDGGVANEVRNTVSREAQGGARAAVLGIGVSGQYTYGTGQEEARSLQDLTFVHFERLANESGPITELGPDARSTAAWDSGEIHQSLTPGQLVRIEADVHLLDGSLFDGRIERFVKLATSIANMSPAGQPVGQGRSQANRLQAAQLSAILGGATPDSMKAIVDAVAAVVGDSVSMRVLPCGVDHLEYSFSGALLGRREYLQEERENLFSRYGQAPSAWTAVLQVASIPSAFVTPSQPGDAEWMGPSGELNRPAMESYVNNLMTYMEQIGIVDGPRWPSISVTPLGLYRTVPSGTN